MGRARIRGLHRIRCRRSRPGLCGLPSAERAMKASLKLSLPPVDATKSRMPPYSRSASEPTHMIADGSIRRRKPASIAARSPVRRRSRKRRQRTDTASPTRISRSTGSVPSCSSCVMSSCARACRLSAASIHATRTLASRTHSAIVEVRAIFESVSAEGDDTLQVVQALPGSDVLALVGRPWPPTTSLRQDASSILRAQSCQFFGQFLYACARCGHLQASVDPFSTRSNRTAPPSGA